MLERAQSGSFFAWPDPKSFTDLLFFPTPTSNNLQVNQSIVSWKQKKGDGKCVNNLFFLGKNSDDFLLTLQPDSLLTCV